MQTRGIEQQAKEAGVSSTVWLLWTADRAMRATLTGRLQPSESSPALNTSAEVRNTAPAPFTRAATAGLPAAKKRVSMATAHL